MVAILPGISRSGSTITGGLFAGLKREDAVRFSFLLSLPAILGANILKLPELFDDPSFSAGLPVMAAGVAAALLSGIAAIKLLKYISENKKIYGLFGILYHCRRRDGGRRPSFLTDGVPYAAYQTPKTG